MKKRKTKLTNDLVSGETFRFKSNPSTLYEVVDDIYYKRYNSNVMGRELLPQGETVVVFKEV